VTDGNVVDYEFVRQVILTKVRPRFKKLTEVGYDPWNAAHLTSQLLTDGVPMIEVRQGYGSLSGPSKLLEALVLAKRVTHDGNPVLRWCVANCEVASDPAGNIKPVKPGGDARGTRRIDGVVAAVTALSRLMVAPEAKRSVYAERGVTVIRW
jgi:phage terminase large subunit-like protein